MAAFAAAAPRGNGYACARAARGLALAFIATNILGASCVVHCVQSIDANMILSFRQLELLLTPSPPIFRDPNS